MRQVGADKNLGDSKVTDTDESKRGYEAGPSDAMKKEIGQVVINHALCDSPLLDIFQILSGTSITVTFALVRTLNIKAGAMIVAIKALSQIREPAMNPAIQERLSTALLQHDKLSRLRNEIAHWQWHLSLEGVDAAHASNDWRRNPDNSQVIKKFTLEDLKNVSLGLINVYAAFNLISATLQSTVDGEHLIKIFVDFDEVLKRVQDAVLGLPEPLAEELS
ncbi:hypothetical protein J3P89_17930 [Pseudomonas sp. Z1-14]|uniref:hypothetical protein n=1 Tax=Pseudomonas sp. Z1-14 TaxID=2817409 RepID=UPI003DA7B131